MTLNTVIMVTRTKLLFVADIHINACTFIIYNEQNYKCRTQFFYDFHCQVLFIRTIYKLDEGLFMHMCIHNDGTVQTEVTLS